MDSSWSEVQHICDPNLNKVSPVSAVCWDPYHELLWVGNDSVRNTFGICFKLHKFITFVFVRVVYLLIMEKVFNDILLLKRIKMNKFDRFVLQIEELSALVQKVFK